MEIDWVSLLTKIRTFMDSDRTRSHRRQILDPVPHQLTLPALLNDKTLSKPQSELSHLRYHVRDYIESRFGENEHLGIDFTDPLFNGLITEDQVQNFIDRLQFYQTQPGMITAECFVNSVAFLRKMFRDPHLRPLLLDYYFRSRSRAIFDRFSTDVDDDPSQIRVSSSLFLLIFLRTPTDLIDLYFVAVWLDAAPSRR